MPLDPAFLEAVGGALGRPPRPLELALLAEAVQAAQDAEALEGSPDLPPQLGEQGTLVPAFASSPEGAWARLRASGATSLALWAGGELREGQEAFALGLGLAPLDLPGGEPIPAALAVGCRARFLEAPGVGAQLFRLEGCAPEALGRGAQARALAEIALIAPEPSSLVMWALERSQGLELDLGSAPTWGFAVLAPGEVVGLSAWGVTAVPAGRSTGGDRIRLHRGATVEADLPLGLALASLPAPFSRVPEDSRPLETGLPLDLGDEELEQAFLGLLQGYPPTTPTEAAWEPGESLAISVAALAHLGALDPFWGAATAVVEAAQALASLGAEPLGVALALPGQAPSEALLGLRQACLSLELPVLELRRLEGIAAPVVAALGEVEPGAGPVDVAAPEARGLLGTDQRTGGIAYRRAFDGLFLLGARRGELGGSRILELRGGQDRCPEPWLDDAFRLQACVREGVRVGLFRSAHGVGRGGLLIAALEGAARSDLGCQLLLAREGLRLDALCFGEAPGRVLVTVSGEGESALRTLARTHRVPFAKVGVVGGDRFSVAVDGAPLVDASLEELRLRDGSVEDRTSS